MTFSNSDNARNTLKYTGQNYQFTPAYARNRDPTIHDIKDPKNQGYYPYTALWINKTNDNLWALVKIANNLATWILLSGGGAQTLRVQVDATTAPGVNPVTPDGTGLLTITGAQVATGTIGGNVLRTHTVALNQFNIEIQRSTAVAATDITKNGVSHFNSAQFTVDANAFVGLVGGTGPAIQSLTGDDALPVVPTAGNINLTGVTVASATHAKPLFFVKNAVSTEELDIQLSTAITAPANSNLAGISSFDTASFSVNSNGWVTSKAAFSPGFSNLGFSYAAGTFTVTSANGTALSATNVGYVTFLHPTNFSQLITLPVNVPYTFTDAAGTNDIGANLFSTTTAVAWGNDCPFYLYAIINSALNDVAFAFSRVPNLALSPAAANIAIAGTTAATTQGSMFALRKNGATITVANFATQTVIPIGSFRMQKSAANAWTVQSLNANGDGVGSFNESTTFTFPAGQMGAAAGKYFANNGGTAPAFTSAAPIYQIFKTGQVIYNSVFSNCTVSGVGAVALQLVGPLNGTGNFRSAYSRDDNSGGTTQTFVSIGQGSALISFTRDGIFGLLPNTVISNAGIGDNFTGTFIFWVSKT